MDKPQYILRDGTVSAYNQEEVDELTAAAKDMFEEGKRLIAIAGASVKLIQLAQVKNVSRGG